MVHPRPCVQQRLFVDTTIENIYHIYLRFYIFIDGTTILVIVETRGIDAERNTKFM